MCRVKTIKPELGLDLTIARTKKLGRNPAARKADITPDLLSEIENGRLEVSPDLLEGILGATSDSHDISEAHN